VRLLDGLIRLGDVLLDVADDAIGEFTARAAARRSSGQVPDNRWMDENEIARLDPEVQPLARELLSVARGESIPLVITRAAGCEFDVAVLDAHGEHSWPDDWYLWRRVGRFGAQLGLDWGDGGTYPGQHFELGRARDQQPRRRGVPNRRGTHAK
jgi:hypothetical protein